MKVLIKKVLSIKNIGRFVNCSQKGPELNRCNLFFAENGRGKTTLCAVLRSLQTGQIEHISERKTIGPISGDPSVNIRLDVGNANFGKNGWNVIVPEIAIFDATFVARNVHAGEYVGRDHRSNLLQVIIGEEGIALAEKVNQLDEAIRNKNSDINNSKKVLQASIPVGTKLDDFLALADDAEIDTKIAAKIVERDAAKQADSINIKPPLTTLNIPIVPAALLRILATTLEDVSATAEKFLKDHIAFHNMHEHGEQWISEGLGYLHDDTCPFCGRDTKELPLVEAYKQYFSEAYNALIGEIDQLRTATESALGAASIAGLGKNIATNETGVQFWKQFVDTAVDTPDYDKTIVPVASRLRKVIINLVSTKQASPLSVVALGDEFESALSAFDEVCVALSQYNVAVAAFNNLIAAQKAKVLAANTVTIERELAAMELVKFRHDPKIVPLCNEYTRLFAEKGKLEKNKDAAKVSLDDQADKMIRDYETIINKLLSGFGAGFTITNSKKTYIGGKPISIYQILINGQAVDLGDVSTPIGQPSFRTTLSAGDKSTLALAFFLAKLDHDPQKAKRIVVFDDPFNSQDRSRRERTAELLKKYGKDCAQLLLLSHDPFFLSLVFSKLPKVERHALQLSRAPDNTTTIEEWDVEKETQDGYFKDHAALSSYLLNGAKELVDIARKIRPVLEGYHRYRFPHQFLDNEWLGDMIKRIRESAGAHPMYPALEELEGINDYSKKYHHDTNPGKADNEAINDGELQKYVQRVLKIVGGY